MILSDIFKQNNVHMGYFYYFNTLLFVKLAIPVAVAKQPDLVDMHSQKPFCTLELSSDNKDFPLFTLYFNNDILSFLHVNFIRDQLNFMVTINFNILMKIMT